MVKQTIVQTKVVVTEHLKPRPAAIKRRIKLERSIANGINIAFVVLSAAALIRVGLLVYDTLNSRSGGMGGEILVFPTLILMFWWGYEIGRDRVMDQWEALEDGGEDIASDRTAGTGSRRA